MLKEIRNLIYPSREICLICKEEDLSESHICIYCREKLEIVDEYFHLDSPHIEDVYYSLFYNRFIREVIRDFKFHGKNYLYKALGEVMVDTLRKWDPEIDCITYIPMHRRKEARRGYNQAKLLSLYISKETDVELVDGNLIKSRNTKDQSHSDKLERATNLKNSFKLIQAEDIRDKNILLIDDIITTGATIREASKVLVENGARRVVGLALTSSKNR